MPRLVTSVLIIITNYNIFYLKIKFFERVVTLVIQAILYAVYLIIIGVYIQEMKDNNYGSTSDFYSTILAINVLILVGDILLEFYFGM